ncbi:something about silencing protein 10-like [Dreissena polymorpha]|uniref:something about silencing protein 10-like n=1 Tax=Dreissena polymorpha TaxID=45954 RepID=UPI002264F823|nr:something about silencing protein 10-like [Dreissena polymorpha]
MDTTTLVILVLLLMLMMMSRQSWRRRKPCDCSDRWPSGLMTRTLMEELQDRLCPLKALVTRQQFTGKAADYMHTKYKLVLNYCIYIVFYLMLKSKQTAGHNHPVVKRLLQYRNILKQLEPLDEQMNAEVDNIVARLTSTFLDF